MLKYEVGDKVVFRNIIFLFDAEILEVYNDNEFEEFDYYIRFEDYEGNKEEVLVREKDIIEYAKGTKKHLLQELSKLKIVYTKEEIEDCVKELYK